MSSNRARSTVSSSLNTLAAFCVAAPSLFGVAGVEAQSRERTLYVSARDALGAPVASLAPPDIRVREDGIAREVLRITPATDPMQVALLVDNSEATTSDVSNFREALKAFVAKFPAPHEIAFITIGDRPTIVTEYTSSAAALNRDIDRLFARPGSGTYVLDGIGETARGLQKRDAMRPTIVVLAADAVEFSSLSYEPVLDALKASGAGLYAVTIQEGGGPGPKARTEEYRNRDIVYDRGTRETGGRHQILLTSMAATTAMSALADELLGQYAVVYARPTTLIPPERVVVEAARPGLDVRGTPARVPAGARP